MTWKKCKDLYSSYIKEGEYEAAHKVLSLLRAKEITLFLDRVSVEVELDLGKVGVRIFSPSYAKGRIAIARIRKG